jgi:hypothetical protein
MHFRAFIRIVEVLDFNPPSDSDDDGRPSNGDSSEEDYPGYELGRSFSNPGLGFIGLL